MRTIPKHLIKRLSSSAHHHGRTHLCQVTALSSIQNKHYSSSSEYLQQSILETNHFQDSLPRLPIPKLEKTCERYLASQKVILTPSEYEQTEQCVQEFQQNSGPKFNNLLQMIDKINKHTSYITGPWFDMYLKDRRPVVLTHTPYIAFVDETRPGYGDQLIRASNLVYSSMRFMKTLQAGYLEPEIYHLNPKQSDTPEFRRFIKRLPKSLAFYGAFYYKAFPLDMSQYGNLFQSTRIPRPDRDALFTDKSARHLLVMRNGHFYVFDVLDKDGNIIKPIEIMANLKYILSDNSPPAEYPIASLTAQDRNTWTDVRQKLISADCSPVRGMKPACHLSDNPTGNEEAICQIDSAVFALCLDTLDSEDPVELSRSYLYGDTTNRWFDKSFTFIIGKNGKSAMNFEHSWGDGVAVMRYINDVMKDAAEKSQIHPDTQPAQIDSSSAVRKLEFNLTDELKAHIRTAQGNLKSSVSNLDLNYLKYEKINKSYLKQKKVSPDAFMQLAIQMAYYRQTGETAATYESCSTAAFKHGRTETVRSATSATKKATEMFFSTSSKPSASELRACLDECSKIHNGLTKNAAMGQGFDRHMFALKHIANSFSSDGLPDIFLDPAYAKLNKIILSTSTVSSPFIQIGGFAPVSPDGYGIGYGAVDDYCGFNISAFADQRNLNEFLDCIKDSFDVLHETLEKN